MLNFEYQFYKLVFLSSESASKNNGLIRFLRFMFMLAGSCFLRVTWCTVFFLLFLYTSQAERLIYGRQLRFEIH